MKRRERCPCLRLDWVKVWEAHWAPVIGSTKKSKKSAVLLLKPKIVKLTTVSGADYQ